MNALDEWLQGRPESIKEAVRRKPPDLLYRLVSTGHICYIMSYVEPDAGPHECAHCKANRLPKHLHQGDPVNATVSVGITSRYNPNLSFDRRVFGIKLDDLAPLDPEEQALVERSFHAESN